MGLVAADVYLRFWELRGKYVHVSFGSDHAGMALEHLVQESHPGATSTTELTEAALKHCKDVKRNHRETLDTLGLFHHKVEWTLGENARKLVNSALEKLNEHNLVKECLYPTLVSTSNSIKPISSSLALDRVYKRRNVYLFNIHVANFTFKVSIKYPEYYLGIAAVGVDANVYQQIIKSNDNNTIVELPLGLKVPMIPIDIGDGKVDTMRLLTPGHSVFDYNICYKHNVEPIAFHDEFGKINVKDFATFGKTFNENAEYISKELENCADAIESVELEEHVLSKDAESRIYTMPMQHMVLDTSELSKDALNLIESGKVVIEPKSRESQLKTTLGNPTPWCITRYGWWGIVPKENKPWVLDTWFSSALWPLIVDANFKNEHRLLYTCHDILHNWVSRMLMLCPLVADDKPPIDKVIFHGMAVDDENEKMSKSKGNALWITQMLQEAHTFLKGRNIQKGIKADTLAAVLVGIQLTSACTRSDLSRHSMPLEQAWWLINKVLECSKFIKLQSKTFDVDFMYDLPHAAAEQVHEMIGNYLHHLIEVATCALEELEFNKALEMAVRYADAFSNYAIPLQRSKGNIETFSWLSFWYLQLLRLLMPWFHSVALEMDPPLQVGETNDLLKWPLPIRGSRLGIVSKNDPKPFIQFDGHVSRLYKAAGESSGEDELTLEVWGNVKDVMVENVTLLQELIKLTLNKRFKIKVDTKS